MGNKIKHKYFRRVSFFSGAIFAVLLALIFFPLARLDNDTQAAPVQSTTTLMLTTSDISAEITPDSATGTFVASDPATIGVRTNNYTGYTIGITASDNVNNTKLINTNDDSVYLTSISSASDPEEFNVGNWGYLPDKLNSVANSKYQPAPTTTTTILDTTSTANQNPKPYRITLGVKADYTLPTGTYENTFNVAAVANPVTYAITYDKNTEDTVTNMPADLVGDTTATSVTVSSLVPQREGYIFLGWNTAADGSGTTYNPNGGGTDLTYDINQTTANAGTLYAQWKSNRLYLQDVTTETCPTTATIAYDNRDETSYHIQKLADGRCWMLDNLALDLTDSDVLDNVTASNTNASTTSLNYLKNGGGTTSDQYATAGVANWTSSYSYSAPLVNMDSKDVVPDNAPTNGQGDNKVGGYYNYCAASAGSYCYGNGTSSGTSSGNATEDICPAGWRMPTSHTGEYGSLANIVYGSMDTTSNITNATNYRNVLSLPSSGTFYEGSAKLQGSGGYFWSNTRSNDASMYFLYAAANYVYPSSFFSRDYGRPMRCLVKNDAIVSFNANNGSGEMANQIITDGQIVSGSSVLNSNTFTRANYIFIGWNTATDGSGVSYVGSSTYTGASTTLYAQWEYHPYIQDFTTATCPVARTSVYDIRDEKTYYIQKITTGSTTLCWMTSNLNIAGGTTLTPATSNVASNYTLPASSTAGFNDPTKAFVYNDNTYGGYYSYAAVTAGTNPSSGSNATSDICPAGWRLPTKTEYKALISTYSTGAALTASPWYGTYSSAYYNGAIDNDDLGSVGYYWSSTSDKDDNTYASMIYISNSGVEAGGFPKALGLSARCVAK